MAAEAGIRKYDGGGVLDLIRPPVWLQNCVYGADQFRGAERFREQGGIKKAGRQMNTSIARNEDKRLTQGLEKNGHRLDALAADIGIEHGEIALTACKRGERLPDGRDASRDFEIGTAQDMLDFQCDNRVVLDYKRFYGHYVDAGLKLRRRRRRVVL
jgi:hypothetical protein